MMIGGKLKKRLNPYPPPPAEAIPDLKRTRTKSAASRSSFFMFHYILFKNYNTRNLLISPQLYRHSLPLRWGRARVGVDKVKPSRVPPPLYSLPPRGGEIFLDYVLSIIDSLVTLA
jgi:hypothetical protein